MRAFFNLIAALISKALGFKDSGQDRRLAENEAQKISSYTDGIIQKYFTRLFEESGAGLYISQETVEEILRLFDDGKYNNFYVFRSLITKLDSLITEELFYNLFKFNVTKTTRAYKSYFECLNDNSDETGILVLPFIHGKQTCFETGSGKRFRRASLRTGLDADLNNIFYIRKADLQGYKLNNLVVDFPLKSEDYVTVAASPSCVCGDKPIKEIKFEEKDGDLNMKFFSVELADGGKINEVFGKVLDSCARQGDIDFALGAEALGTSVLCGENVRAFNEFILGKMQDGLPQYIIPPSYSNDSDNVIKIFADSGQKLGEQSKQVSYILDGYEEDLRKSKKEILVLHIKGLGRVCFAICKDFPSGFQDILTRQIRANLILCPSYSRSSATFQGAAYAAIGHDCRVVWINCCAALLNPSDDNSFIGLAAGNYIPTPVYYCKCKAGKKCGGCYFKIKIPLNAATEDFHNDKPVGIEQILL